MLLSDSFPTSCGCVLKLAGYGNMRITQPCSEAVRLSKIRDASGLTCRDAVKHEAASRMEAMAVYQSQSRQRNAVAIADMSRIIKRVASR